MDNRQVILDVLSNLVRSNQDMTRIRCDFDGGGYAIVERNAQYDGFVNVTLSVTPDFHSMIADRWKPYKKVNRTDSRFNS